MKKLCTIILFLLAFAVRGQDFGAVGTEWYYSFDDLPTTGDPLPPDYTYLHLESVSDTVIGNKSVHKIVMKVHVYGGNIIDYGSLFVYQSADTVYYYDTYRDKFLRLYVFDKAFGQSIELDAPYVLNPDEDSTYHLGIDAVTIDTINGIALKKYSTFPVGNFKIDGNIFMDRVGGLNWFMPVENIPAMPAYGPLRCYKDADITINFLNRPCDYLSPNGILEVDNKERIKAFPNPFTNHLTLQLPGFLNNQLSVALYDLQGQKIYASESNWPGSENDLNLELPEMPAGLYFLHLITGEESYTLKVQCK